MILQKQQQIFHNTNIAYEAIQILMTNQRKERLRRMAEFTIHYTKTGETAPHMQEFAQNLVKDHLNLLADEIQGLFDKINNNSIIGKSKSSQQLDILDNNL